MSTETGTEYRIGTDSSSYSVIERCKVTVQQQKQSFNGLFSRTTWVSRYQKGKTNLDFTGVGVEFNAPLNTTGARVSEWQRHQLGHMQVCTSLQTENHASTPTTLCFTGWMPFLPPNQQRQSTEGTCKVTVTNGKLDIVK